MLGFLHPAALLLLLPSIALIVFAYLRLGRTKPLIVNSLFFLSQLPRLVPSGRTSFIPPARFFFDLLLISLLCVALAGLFLKGNQAEQLTFVVDNSLGMGAKDSSGTLLYQARESIVSSLQLRSSSSRASIWVTSPSPRELTQGHVDPAEAVAALAQIKPEFAADNLERTVVLASAASKRVFVVSDRLPAAENTQILGAETGPRHLGFRTGEPALSNIALVNASLAVNPQEPDSTAVSVGVQAFTTRPVRATLFIEALPAATSSSWQRLAQNTVDLRPQERREVAFTVAKQAGAAYRVTLAPQDANQNSLNLDDTVWFTPSNKGFTLQVASPYTLTELGLNKLHGIELQQIPLQQLSKQELSKRTDGPFIFHHVSPPELPNQDAVFIMPPTDSSLFKIGTAVKDARLTRWQDDHPLLAYLSFQAMSQSTIMPFENVPAWSTPLITTSGGIAAFAGIRGGHRYAALGLEVLPFEGKKSPAASILLLNILKWLGQSGFGSGYGEVRKPFDFRGEIQRIEIIDSFDAAKSKALEGQLPVEAGLYRLTSAAGQELRAVNFLDQTESNTLAPPPYQPLQASPELAGSSALNGRNLVVWLSLLLILLISGEVLLRFLPKRSVGAD